MFKKYLLWGVEKMLNLFKKKKEAAEEIELPPPPKPPELPSLPEAPEAGEAPELDFPDIKPSLTELPELEEKEDFEEFEMPKPREFAHPTVTEHEFPEFPPGMEEEEHETPEKVFDRTIKEVAPSREEVMKPQEIKPMFVSVDDFANLTANTNFVRSKLVEAEEYLQRLTDLKNQELKAFDTWKKTLENVEQKLSYVDQVIAKAQG